MPFCCRVFLVSLLAALSASGQDRADCVEAVREFKRFFKQFKELPQQREAVLTLLGQECPEAVEELLKLSRHKSPVIRQTAMSVMSSYRQASTFQPWMDDLASLRPEQQVTMIRILGNAGIRDALTGVLELLQKPKSTAQVKFEAARALAKIGNESVAGSIAPLLGDSDALVRMAAIDCVGKLPLRALAKDLVPLLDDKEWQVQSAAVTAVGVVRPQGAVQPLIDLMRKSGRLQIECSEALFRVTGLDFGLDPDRWQKQWDVLMGIEGWRIPTEEELAKRAASRAKYDELYGAKTKRNTFAGIPTTSTRVLFIIDVSGSMDDLVVERDKFEDHDGYEKFLIVSDHLTETIDTLTSDTYFDIVAFATDVKAWKKKLVSANIVNRASAKAWVERLKPLGGTEDQELASAGLGGLVDLAAGKTNTLKALLYPFGIDGDKPPPKQTFTKAGKASIKNKLDTVYFLSDGRPSVGRLVDTREILDEVRSHNAVFRIVFHAIAIGEFQKAFLRDLAQQNGGVFVDLGR